MSAGAPTRSDMTYSLFEESILREDSGRDTKVIAGNPVGGILKVAGEEGIGPDRHGLKRQKRN